MPSVQIRESSRVSGVVERRRRARISSKAKGWLIRESGKPTDPEPWEVLISDISRYGVGFESTERMEPGTICRIRIGYGPMRLARRIRIVNCRTGARGHYLIGAEFVSASDGG